MATTTSDPMKARIITHMNADHAFSLQLYARHYNRLPLATARTATLEDITTSHLIMTSSFGRLLVPLDPPLSSLGQARDRLVAMHNDCLAALDVADVQVSRYTPPNRLHQWAFLVGASAVLLTFPFRASLHPDSGSWLAWAWGLGGRLPWLAETAWRVAPLVWPLTLGIHVLEVRHMMVSRLRRYGVEPFSALWWAWVLDNFFEGFGAFARFDEVVAEERARKGLAKVEVRGEKGREARERKAAGGH
ncbi:uncharacterized protein HMPREF1541_03715 [Cyphellophora europaea CBS 101466]|uniref:DUF2470 domain-containing protein n=1 Tax=Cyphellophora europaea (strain CBS 101466) TaxID=1220924 RepID=W2S139_CYPE1|nr:uncharacterized protein HMPREF1541_03715 [Cyphellophora europaea CBS 101466]ETN41778.1 hypothetical protein HMPREF1541_03715 [Cyphellophora europaea CBS 101466]